MRVFKFGTSTEFSLEQELLRPFEQIAAQVSNIRIVSGARLRRPDGTALEIWSEMHAVETRLEVGVLRFQLVTADGERRIPFFTNGNHDSLEFGYKNRVEKLVVQVEDCLAESGIVITSQQGDQLFIVANAFPCHIAIQGIPNLHAKFDPEYELSEYRRVAVDEDYATSCEVSKTK